MTSLDDLALKHGTDKSSIHHDFARVYDAWFAHLRDAPVVLLELGVWEGASLRMWRDYFRNGEIWGLDCFPDHAVPAEERISIVIGEQTDETALAQVADGRPLDIVIDDAGHWPLRQQRSLLLLWPRLATGGFYVIEDTHSSYMPKFGAVKHRNPDSTVEFLKGLADDVHADYHDFPATLPDLDSISFHRGGTCVLRKS